MATAKKTIAETARARDRPVKPYEVRAVSPQGLLVRVQPSGRRTYYLSVTKNKRVRIGPADVLTLKKAEERAKAILLDPSSATAKTRGGITLREYLDAVYEEHAKATTKTGAATVKRIRALWSTLLDKRMSDIASEDVDKIRKKRIAEGASAGTVNRDVFPLRGVLTHWAKQTGVAVHPLRGLEPFKVDADEVVRYLEPAEEKRLRAALAVRDKKMIAARASANAWRVARDRDPLPELSGYADYLHPMVLLSLNTGLRQGETFSLTWGDVDFHHKNVTVRASKAKGRRTRVVPANAEAMSVLKAIKPKDAALTDLVFPSRVTGTRLNNIKRAWGEVAKTAKLPTDFTWHGLRHSFATALIDKGVSLYEIKELLGHANIRTTEVYAKNKATALRAAVNKLGR